MKKTLIAIFALVLVLSMSCLIFVGCNGKDGEEKAAAPSNSETLGAAAAVAASYAAGGAGSSAQAEGETDTAFKAGIDLDVTLGGSQFTAGATAFSTFGSSLAPMIDKAVNSVDDFLKENGITVAEVTSDDENYSNKYSVKVTYVDEETGDEKTDEYALYVNVADGVEIEGNTSYAFNAKLSLAKVVSFTFSGNATFSTEKNAMVFTFDLGVGALASVEVDAYATSEGNIAIEIGANALGIVNASVKVELGKLDNGKYGAEITVKGNVNAGVANVDFTAVVSVIGAYDETAHSFTVNGNIDATADIVMLGKYNAKGDITGVAKYNTADDELEVGLSGTLALTQVVEEDK